MKKAFAVLALILASATLAAAAPAARYLHVRVEGGRSNGQVNINLPLPLAAAVLPAITNGQLKNGMVTLGGVEINGVNIHQILEALKTAPDGNFLTVRQGGNNVQVAKKNGVLFVHVDHSGAEGQQVSITVPWAVAVALTTGAGPNQLNVEAALQALENVAPMTLVSVTGGKQNVRIWIDANGGEE